MIMTVKRLLTWRQKLGARNNPEYQQGQSMQYMWTPLKGNSFSLQLEFKSLLLIKFCFLGFLSVILCFFPSRERFREYVPQSNPQLLVQGNVIYRYI